MSTSVCLTYRALSARQVTTEPFKTKSTDLQPVVIVGESMTLAVDVTDLNPANHVLRVRTRNYIRQCMPVYRDHKNIHLSPHVASTGDT